MSRVAKRFYRVDSLYSLDNLDRGETAGEENRWVFEISHEAANKGERNEGRPFEGGESIALGSPISLVDMLAPG